MAMATQREPVTAPSGADRGTHDVVQSRRSAAMIRWMYDARTRHDLADCLSGALLVGAWSARPMADRAGRAVRPRPWWTLPLVRAVLSAYPRPPLDRPRELARFVDRVLAALPARDGDGPPPRPRHWEVPAPAMGRRPWPVPEIASLGELARFLELSDGELAWFADLRSLERTARDERLRHYRYGTFARPGRPVRVIERPKHRLKEIQRRVLHGILDWIPAHDAAHGFTRGRSVRSHAGAHAGRHVVIRLDLRDFFASVGAGRVYGILRSAGYPESVAHTLTGLVTNAVPAGFWQSLPRPTDPDQIAAHHHLGRQLATPHLPQGAPSSPALANLAAFRLDRRLTGLAERLECSYTRYADDLTFSGSVGLVGQAALLRRAAADIARAEGFAVNDGKSTLATRAGRQRVCGVVVNEHPNVARDEYDRLRAILHNAILHGPQSQNRAGVEDFRAHLLGRIAWVAALNPGRGEKLHREFAAVRW